MAPPKKAGGGKAVETPDEGIQAVVLADAWGCAGLEPFMLDGPAVRV
jgi:hypothetical protein